MLLLPTQVEQVLTATSIMQSGAGTEILLETVKRDFCAVLDDLLQQDHWSNRARTLQRHCPKADAGPSSPTQCSRLQVCSPNATDAGHLLSASQHLQMRQEITLSNIFLSSKISRLVKY
jgi:hypothetical protein